MISTNKGNATEATGSWGLNGSNETVTVCRFATAKAMMMMASGTKMTAATSLRSKTGPPPAPDERIRPRPPD